MEEDFDPDNFESYISTCPSQKRMQENDHGSLIRCQNLNSESQARVLSYYMTSHSMMWISNELEVVNKSRTRESDYRWC